MPDPILILKSAAAAAVAAALVLLAAGWPWRSPRPGRLAAGSAIGAGIGIALGVFILDAMPHYPPREDQDRLLLILLPAAIVAEIIAVGLQRTSWAAGMPRLAVAAATGLILLHGSVYLNGEPGPDSLAWTPREARRMLCGLAVALTLEWALLGRLAQRQSNRAVVASLMLAVGAAGIAVMLTGYASGGMLGAPIAGALAGVALASLCLSGVLDLRGAVGVGVVSLFALVVVGHFFGDLPTTIALLLFFAPLLGWLPELPAALRSRPLVRGTARILLITTPIVLALVLAVMKFKSDSESKSPAPGANEPSMEDYLNFGK
jgi:hypothetical protein